MYEIADLLNFVAKWLAFVFLEVCACASTKQSKKFINVLSTREKDKVIRIMGMLVSFKTNMDRVLISIHSSWSILHR